MDLITTHINSDFDAFGSLVAAKKLYPDSRLLLPGSQERAVRDFLSLAKDVIKIETEKECGLEGVDRLILVDTRHRSRIGVAAQLVERGIEVHIYDHHPRMKGDIVADKEVYLAVGATITILTDLIRRKKIPLSYLEATIMLLGIYEETGSLTYRSTTKMDVDAVSFLLSRGANLSVVSSYLNRELSEEELSFLTKLINATERISIKGVSVSVIELPSGDFSGEIGMLIHKLMDIENIPVLFVFIKTPAGRVNLIARSRLDAVDVNKVLAHFGGGGHPTAAYARIQTGDTAVLKAELVRVLTSSIRVKTHAKDMMKPSPLSLGVNERVEKVRDVLEKNSLEAALVKSGAKVVGIITREQLARAVKGGFGHARIKGYMSPSPVSVGPGTPLYAIKELAVKKNCAIVPVMKGRKLLGVIDRLDILKRLHSGMFAPPPSTEKRIVENLAGRMRSLLPARVFALLKRIGGIANANGYSAFVVGGLVRDLVMGTRNLDLDIVVEGDAITFAGKVACRIGGTVVAHRRFGTASIYTKGGLKIDLATARKEVYKAPAALPTVEFSSLKYDLIRRDFTINAMAASINKENFGQLIDFFGGEEDLRHGRIRVLHDSSFIDDPTRIFRAVRFEQRFGFVIDSRTEDLIRHAISREMFDRTEKQRIRDEIILILKEPNPLKALRRMNELHELKFIHPRIKFSKKMETFFKSIEEVLGWFGTIPRRRRTVDGWILFLMALTDDLSRKELDEFCGQFVFRNADRIRLASFKAASRRLPKILAARKKIAASSIYAMLEPLSYETMLALLAKSGSAIAKDRVEEFFRRCHGTRLRIRGEDLKRLGLKPGPRFRKILAKVLYRKIDGRLKDSKKDELKYAKALVRGAG